MKTKKNKIDPDICSLIFQQVEKPDHFEMCRAINVYDNRYRINIYTKKYDEIYQVERMRIEKSYFCSLVDGDLNILF